MDNVFAEGSVDVDHKVLVGEEEEAVNEAIGSVVVEECTDGGHRVLCGDEEMGKEMVGSAVVKENTDGEIVQVGDEETLDETTVNAIVEESTDGGHTLQHKDEEMLKETMGNAIVDESIDEEPKEQMGDEETLNETTGNAIVEESTDGADKVQCEDEETLKETMGNAIVEESTDEEHKVQVGDEETLNETTGNAIVEESTDGVHKVQHEDGETLKETVGNAIVEESNDEEHKVQVGDEETLNKTIGNASVEGSADGEHMAQAGEKKALNETMGDTIVKECIDGEQNAAAEQEEALNETKGLNETRGNIIVEESTDGEHIAQVREEVVLTETLGNAIVEEGTDGEHKVQVGDEETLNKTTGNASVEESDDGEYMARAREEKALNETMDDTIVKESTDGEQNVPPGEEEALNETKGNIIVEESTDAKHIAQVREEVVLTETLGNVIVEESTDGEHQAKVWEEEALSETMGDGIVEESNDGRHKAQVREEEVLNETTGDGIVEEIHDVEHRRQVRKEEELNITMGYAIVEESTMGEHIAQVIEAETLTETLGNAIIETTGDGIVKEIYDVEHRGQVRKEEALNGTMGNVIVEDATKGEHIAQVVEAEALTETLGNVIIEESIDVEHKAKEREAEALTELMGDVIMEESTVGEHKAQVREAETLTETIGDVIMEESTVGEHKAQVGGAEAVTGAAGNVVNEKASDGEVLNNIEKQVIQSTASGTGIIYPMEAGQQVTYHLSSLDKANFSISDLVWGKVKSHPWWPGQIFDTSDASKLAMKYQKKDSFLIAYYGDKTFAWCDESQLKPFHSYFSQLEKQCSSDTFIKAIHDILMEVSRRVELGMACSCLPEEDYTKIKYQKIENAGIRGGNINSIIDRSAVANYLEPEKLLEYIKTLAQFPNGRVDKLEFVIAQSQLKAFYHLKGYPELPVFTVSGGLLESVPENPPSNDKGCMEEFVGQCTPVCSNLISAKETPKSEKSSFNKQENGVEGDVQRKSTSKLTEDVKALHLANGGKSNSVAKAAEKPISSFSGKKHIIIESDPADSGRCKRRMLDSFEDIEFKSPSPSVSSSFKIGEFIRRAASQLTGGPPILKCQGETVKKDGHQVDHKIDDVADFDIPPDSPVENQRTNLSFIEDYNSPNELLSQLCLAAKHPMEEYNFLSTIVDFFTDFRNFCVSSSSEETEHVEKRKRGRPKKVLSQQAASDAITSEDEKHVQKRKRGMNVISQIASSDISSENEKPVEKPVEKRRRGRPRKNPLPASSDSEDMKPLQKPKRGRPRGRPRKVDSQLPSPDNISFENEKLVETRKRGRPRKVNSEMVPAGVTTPDHLKDSYWSDMDLQNKRNSKSLIQYRKKRRKSTGEQSLCQLTPTLEEQLQLAMNPDMKLTFVAERSIISVEEKIVDECMPTALLLSFNKANLLPSETHLIRIFSRYGPLKEAETEVLKKTNRAKVVFKRRVDAEAAFSSAGKYSIFGPGLLSYQLKPWSPKSTPQAVPLGTQEAAPAAAPEDSDDVAHIFSPANILDTEPSSVPQDNLDAPFIPTPKDMHDLSPHITTQDYYDLAPTSMVQDNHDAAQDKCINKGISVGNNLELSELEETVLASNSIQVEVEGRGSSGGHDHPELISTSCENQDQLVVPSLLDEHNLMPTSTEDNLDAATITMVQDNPDGAVIITLQNKCDADPAVGSKVEFSEQAENVVASDAMQIEDEGKESSPHEKHGPGLIIEPEEKQDTALIAFPLDEHDLTSISTEDKPDVAPNTKVEDSHDLAAVITLQDKCDAGPTVRRNLEFSEQAEDVIVSDIIQMEVKGEESSPHGKYEPALIAAAEENQDVIPAALPPQEKTEDVIASDAIQMEVEGEESSKHDKYEPVLIAAPEKSQDVIPVASLQGDDNSTPINKQVNPDGAPIVVVENNLDVTDVIELQDKYNAEPLAGSNLEFSGKVEAVVASDTTQVEAEGKESLLQRSQEPAFIIVPEQNQNAEPCTSLPDQRDSTPTTTHDNLNAAQISLPLDNYEATSFDMREYNQDAESIASLPQDNCDVAPIAKPQDNRDTVSIVALQEKCDAETTVGNQVEDVLASKKIQVEVGDKESLPQDKLNPALITTLQQNQDAEPIAALLGKHNSIPPTTQADVDAASICMPQDNEDVESSSLLPHGTVPITIPGDNRDAVSIATDDCDVITPITASQDNHDAEPITTAQDKHELELIIPAEDSHSLAPTTAVEVNRDAAVAVALQDKEQADGAVASDTIQVEVDIKESPPQDGHDPALTAAQQRNQDTEPVASLLDKHVSVPAITPDNLDAASIMMVPDNHDAAPITTPNDKYNAALLEGCNIQVSEQAESEASSETMRAEGEGEGCNLEASERAETIMASGGMQI